jgi:predicted dehydrogenase
MFEKELSLRMSTSYGPGRYDRSYEEGGNDYPISYVRWTENRNLQAFLSLLGNGILRPNDLDTEVCQLDDAVAAYEALVSEHRSSLAVVFEYGDGASLNRNVSLPAARASTRQDNVAISFIGAGNYARAILLPAIKQVSGVERITLVTATGASALKSAQRFGFRGCGTEAEAVFKDPNVDFVFIATRHDSHAPLAIEAMKNGKAVWLEKPIGLDLEEVRELFLTLRETESYLAVGYNRRFSQHAEAIRRNFDLRKGPMRIHYRIAPGTTPTDSWLTDPREGGGRIVGEVCHFVDLCSYLTRGPVERVYALPLGDGETDDSITAVLSYADGSTATIDYLANASTELPKEYFEVSADGKTAQCTNFRTTTLSGRRLVKTFNQDKGQQRAVSTVLDTVRRGEPSPFTADEILNVSLTCFAIQESIGSRSPVAVGHIDD